MRWSHIGPPSNIKFKLFVYILKSISNIDFLFIWATFGKIGLVFISIWATFCKIVLVNYPTWWFKVELNHDDHERGEELQRDIDRDDGGEAKVGDVVVTVDAADIGRDVDDVAAQRREDDGPKVADESLDAVVATHFL